MAVRMLWKFVVGRTKTLFKNYNVIERADKTMEGNKRVPPRHPGTEAKFKVLIKERPEILEEMEKKPVELLDRLKIVKVSSQGGPEDEEKNTKPLPVIREYRPTPAYGFEEPKVMPEGKCNLRQALEFITDHQNNPSSEKLESISKTYNMKKSDVQNIINNFKVLELYIPREHDVDLNEAVQKSLGVNKRPPLFAEPFDNVKRDTEEKSEEKK